MKIKNILAILTLAAVVGMPMPGSGSEFTAASTPSNKDANLTAANLDRGRSGGVRRNQGTVTRVNRYNNSYQRAQRTYVAPNLRNSGTYRGGYVSPTYIYAESPDEVYYDPYYNEPYDSEINYDPYAY